MRHFIYCLAGVPALWAAGCAATFNADLQNAKKTRQPVFVGFLTAEKPDKRGSIDASGQIFNTSHKAYKYVDIRVTATNRVGDVIIRDDDRSSVVKLRFTGPLPPLRTSGIVTWPNIWYVQKIACITVFRIDITHMDGNIVPLDGAALDDMLPAKLRKSCRLQLSAGRG